MTADEDVAGGTIRRRACGKCQGQATAVGSQRIPLLLTWKPSVKASRPGAVGLLSSCRA